MMRADLSIARKATACLLAAALLSGCGIGALHRVAKRMHQESIAGKTTASGAEIPSEAREELQAIVRDGRAPGATLILMRGGAVIGRLDVGNVDTETRYP